MEVDRSGSKLCSLVLREESFPLERRVCSEFGGPASILLRVDGAPRRGGGAGGAEPLVVAAVKESLRGILVREALDGVRFNDVPDLPG